MTWSFPRAAPSCRSPHAAQVASLSARTGRPRRASRPARNGKLVDAGQIRCGAQHAVAVDQSGRAHADRRDLTASGSRLRAARSATSPSASINAVLAPRRRPTALADHLAVVRHGHTEHLGAAEIEAQHQPLHATRWWNDTARSARRRDWGPRRHRYE